MTEEPPSVETIDDLLASGIRSSDVLLLRVSTYQTIEKLNFDLEYGYLRIRAEHREGYVSARREFLMQYRHILGMLDSHLDRTDPASN